MSKTATTNKAKDSKESNKAKGDAVSDAELPETYGGSPVSTDLTDADLKGDGKVDVDLSKATISVPSDAVVSKGDGNDADQVDAQAAVAEDQSFARRALNAGIGLVDVLGVNFRYVGRSPQLEKAELPNGLRITGETSTFTPLSEVKFDHSILVKVCDEFKYPDPSVSSWEGVEGLVPATKK